MVGCPLAVFYSCTILPWRKRLLLAGLLAQLDRLEHPEGNKKEFWQKLEHDTNVQ